MQRHKYILKSLINAVGVFIYVLGVSWIMFNSKEIFGGSPEFLTPVFMLLLFVISAAITGLLVLGRPAHLYFSGQKKEALVVLFATLAWLVIFLFLVITALLSW